MSILWVKVLQEHNRTANLYIDDCVGNPEGVNLFRNSTGYNLSLFTVLQLLYCFSISGNEVIIMLLTSSTALLVGAIMATLALLEVMEFER